MITIFLFKFRSYFKYLLAWNGSNCPRGLKYMKKKFYEVNFAPKVNFAHITILQERSFLQECKNVKVKKTTEKKG